MTHAITAEDLLQDLKSLPESEREKFFAMLSEQAFPVEQDLSHAELFGHFGQQALYGAGSGRVSGSIDVNVVALCYERKAESGRHIGAP